MNFRHAVFGGSGYCGLDRGRGLLQGDEIRPCWVAPTTLVAEAVSVSVAADEHPFVDPDVDGGQLTAEQPTRFWIEVDA